MPHGNPIDWYDQTDEDLELVVGTTASPTKWVSISVQQGQTASDVAGKLVEAWNMKNPGPEQAELIGDHQVMFPDWVKRVRLVSFHANGSVASHEIPDDPDQLPIGGLKLSSPSIVPNEVAG